MSAAIATTVTANTVAMRFTFSADAGGGSGGIDGGT
jgi:hypothetical protein